MIVFMRLLKVEAHKFVQQNLVTCLKFNQPFNSFAN